MRKAHADCESFLDGCVRGRKPIPQGSTTFHLGTKMQQYTDFLTLFFINDFQWRPERNKGLHDKTGRLILEFTTVPLNL
jgi:hypothetical protein